MILAIREGAKAIVNYMIKEAVEHGNLKHRIKIQENEVAIELDFDKSKRFKVCLQYLAEKGLITVETVNETHYLTLTAAAIDFLEKD